MKIKKEYLETISLEEFAENYDLTLVIRKREESDSNMKYYAFFENCEVSKGEYYSLNHGNGRTPEEAILRYIENISEQHMAERPYTKKYRSITVPNLSNKLPKL